MTNDEFKNAYIANGGVGMHEFLHYKYLSFFQCSGLERRFIDLINADTERCFNSDGDVWQKFKVDALLKLWHQAVAKVGYPDLIE